MRAPRAIAASMIEAMDHAMSEVWEAEPKKDDGLKRLVFAHVCSSYARRGGYIKRNG